MKSLSKEDKKILKKILKKVFQNKIRIQKVKQQKDGWRVVFFDYDVGFIEWFKEQQGLKRWSRKRFEKILVEAYRKEKKLLKKRQKPKKEKKKNEK